MPQGRDGLRLPLEPLPRARPGVPSVEHRLDRDRAVEPEVPGPEDDPHAAAAEDRFDLIAQDARQSRILRRVRGAVVGGREEHIQVGAKAAHLPPAVADHGQQFRVRPAHRFRRDVRVE